MGKIALERILFGPLQDIFSLIPDIVRKVFEDFKIKKNDIPKDYIEKIRSSMLQGPILDDIKISKLSELSLQQAVDLASLLMRLEIDFQTYTENIPTVGGVIKLAVIDKDGFRFLNGHDVVKPLNV